MLPEQRQLLMRANRLLGAGLVEANLVKIEDLEKANERLLEILGNEQPRESTVLGILAYELKVLREEDLLQYCVDNEGMGLVDLRAYEVHDDVKKAIDLPTCWATWSVPFDHDEDFNFIATAYYLSPAVRSFWEKKFTGPILWFGTTLEVVADYLEKLAIERVAAPPAAPTGTRTPFGAPATGTRSPFGATTPAAKPGAAAKPAAPTPPPAAPAAT
ncbi:MAG: hypothetical protein WCL24_08690 [Verrucomicrobiota bacterium]